MSPTWRRSLVRAAWLSAGIGVSVSVLTYYGFHAVRGWQASSDALLAQRAGAAADLLVDALSRDMHAVQRSVLSTSDWEPLVESSPSEIRNVVASAFAKYPYPECFVASRGSIDPDDLLFFTRSDRMAPWLHADSAGNRFPVTQANEPDVARQILDRVRRDALTGQRFSLFETRIGTVPYQFIIHLRYHGTRHDQLDGLFGFMVNLDWVRAHYFQSVTTQVAGINNATTGLALDIRDDAGRVVADTHHAGAARLIARRRFALLFFDPLLSAVIQPMDLPQREWTVESSRTSDAAAAAPAKATLAFMGCAAVSLVLGLVMTIRAVDAGARLADLRSEFISTVTHELKTPIAAIRAIGDTLASGRIASAAGQREYAQLAVQQAKRLSHLVDNLLALSRITDVTEVYAFEPLSLELLVDRSLETFRQQLRDGAFAADVHFPADLPPIVGDQMAIGLMLDNLIDNAIRYSNGTRDIRIDARQQDQTTVRVDITDKGRGIPDDEIGQVTRKFFRGRQMVSNGSGLGLAIVKRIVEDHRGHLDITSTVGVGTTVSVSFPIAGRDEEAGPYR